MIFIPFKNEQEKNFITTIACLVAFYFFAKYLLVYVVIAILIAWQAVWLGLTFLAFGICIAGIAAFLKYGLPR